MTPSIPLFNSLPSSVQKQFTQFFAKYRFTYQEKRQIIEMYIDLDQWNDDTFFSLWGNYPIFKRNSKP